MQIEKTLIRIMKTALLAVSFMLMLNTAGAEEIAGYKAMPRLTPRPVTVTGLVEIQVSLNGTWRFNPAPPTQFWKTHLPSDTGWADINVPGEWTMQGFKVEKDSAAGYWRNFSVPADWKQHRIKLHCDAVYSNATIWINGDQAGKHEGGFTPFELDVTELIRPGQQNIITLAVKNESLADTLASGTRYAAHQLGGITRKIYLFTVPQLNIASLHVTTEFDKDYRNATLGIMLDIANEGDQNAENVQVRFGLTGPKNKSVSINPDVTKLPAIKAGQILSHEITIPVAAPKQWDAEHPDLYVLSCHLEADGKRLETVRRRFGFRQVEVRGNQLFVNNHPVKLRGICRHEAHPLRGRSLTPQLWRKDAELFRNANINYIRTSHYPPAEEFIEACDELGLFVEEEAPFCWIGYRANPIWKKLDPHSIKYRNTILRATMEMIRRDQSHPSIIIWSLANESAWGSNFEKSFELANQIDPTRPKSFHDQSWGRRNNFGSTTQIANYHYPGPKGPYRVDNSQRPLLFGEYAHLNTYNREEIVTDPGVCDYWGLGFAAMWEKMYESKGCLGGAIWSGVDDVFHLPTGKSVGYGMWGPIDGWRRTKPEYWHIKKVYSPIRVLKKIIPLPEVGKPLKVRIANRHDFTNLSEIRIEWTVAGESGTVKANIPPRGTGAIAIQPKTANFEGKKLSLKFFSPRGFLIDTYLLPIGKSAETKMQSKVSENARLKLIEADEKVTVKGDNFMWIFDRKTGQIQNAKINGRSVLIGGPVLMVLPLKVELPRTGGTAATTTHSADIPPFNDTCRDWKLHYVAVRQTADAVEIKVKGQYKQASGTYSMKIDGAGRLSVDYHFAYNDKVNPRQVGIVFDLPKTCDTLNWQRKAQWTVYPPDHIGRPTGQAKALRDTQRPKIALRSKPNWPWSLDSNALGTNDFRATRYSILWTSLKDAAGYGVMVKSNGTQSTRCWLQDDAIRLLVADFSTGGADPYFARHLAGERRPIDKGDILKDTVHLELIDPLK